MNKENLTVNKKQRMFLPIFIAVFSLFIFIGCNDPVTTDVNLSAPPKGKGSFSMMLSDDARTILPSTPSLNDFAVYNLSFIPISGGFPETADRTNATLATVPIFLEPGTYYLVVNAYRDSEKNQLMAQGTADNIIITSGSLTRATVTLRALLSGGTGTFRWNISIPSDVTLASMSIIHGNTSGTSQETIPLMQPATSGSRTLNSGAYNLTFNLEKADGKTVVWKELLYVYRSLESVFNHTFTNAHFSDSRYTITYRYNDDGLTADGTQSVLHGETATRPADPSRIGYIFRGWYTDNSTFNNSWNFIQPVIESFTLYARWDPLPTEGIILSPTRQRTGRELRTNALWLSVGEREDLIATVLPADTANQNVSWSSSSTNVSVNSNGTIFAQSFGGATITARAQDGREESIFVRVFKPLEVEGNRFQITQYDSVDRIKYSFTYDDFDFYYIYLGEMASIPLAFNNVSEEHVGMNYEYKFERTDAFVRNISDTVSNSTSDAINIIHSNTFSRTDGGVKGWENSYKGNFNLEIKKVLDIGGGFENIKSGQDSWSEYTSNENGISFNQTKSLTNTRESATSEATSKMVSRTWNFDLHDRPGFYRYTMFGVSDIYLYIIRDSKTGVLYYEFIEHVIPEVYSVRLDYSEVSSFRKTDESRFELDIFSILENLPKPELGFATVIFNKNNFDAGSTDANPQAKNLTTSKTNILGTLPSDPVRPGWTFIGWNTEANGSGTIFTENTPVKGILNVYAQWRAVVTFDSNGGNPISQTRTVTTPAINIGTLPTNPARTGWTFTGWNTQANGSGTVFTATTTVPGNTTVYAQWRRNTYTVAYHANGGSGMMLPDSGFTYGVARNLATLNFTHSVSGYIFLGWARTPDSQFEFRDRESVTNLTETDGDIVTLYAQWINVRFRQQISVADSFSVDAPNIITLTANNMLRPDQLYHDWFVESNFDIPMLRNAGYTYLNITLGIRVRGSSAPLGSPNCNGAFLRGHSTNNAHAYHNFKISTLPYFGDLTITHRISIDEFDNRLTVNFYIIPPTSIGTSILFAIGNRSITLEAAK